MARQPFRPVELTEALRPVAAHVDNFIHAQEPSRDTNLQDLARSLSGLGGSLAGMVGERDRKAKEDDKVRGEAAYWQTNGTGAAEAVAKGLIPAQASPAYLKAYKRLEGEVAGGQLEQQFASAYDTWEGKSSTDPKAYDAFLGSFIKSNITTEDPDVLRGLLPKVHQVAANYLQRHIGDASKATQAGYSTALSARGEQAIDEANTAGLSSKAGTDYQGVFGRLEAIRADGLKIGANQEQVDQKLIDTVTASAISKRDPKLLDFLDRKVPGRDYTWSNTPYGRDQKQKTIDALETMGRKSIADDEKKNREELAAIKADTTRQTIKAITENPNGPLPEALLAQGEKVDPDFRVNAITWRNTISKAGGVSDPEAMLGVTSDIINGGGLGRVQKAMRDGVFKNPADLTRAYKLAESMDKGGADIGAIMKGGSAKTILDTIKVRTANDKDASKVFDDGSVSPEGLQAQTDFKLQILAWKEAHPTANAIEQEKAISGIGADILKRIQQPEEMGAVGFDRTGIDGPNTFGANAPPKVVPEDPEVAPAKPVAKPPAAPGKGPVFGNPSVTMPSGLPGDTETPAPAKPATPPALTPAKPAAPVNEADAAEWFNKLDPEVAKSIELKAAQEKKPLTLKAQEVYQRGIERGVIPAPVPSPAKPGKQSSTMRAPDGTPIETASASEEGIGKAFREAIDPPATADTVRLMGEAFQRALAATGKPQGGYSAATLRDDPKAARILDFVAGPESGGNYNAFFGNGRSTKNLSAMTLDQVMAWSGSRGTESSATGRYQFMKATLRGLKTEMGLSGSEPFSPALQDRMAVQLLNRRGYSEWQAGRITDAQFANRLALEWASLPNITAQNGRPAGVSAYAGDGLNRSSVSPASVLGALTGVFRRGMRAVGSSRPRDGETSI
ncbi:hypothetical protein [Methylobacterium sp. E-045]|uniref:hypothetical protein n=1 Tax=Methylobacterium sp. E-045 TaxID=2836575 RepID=UPI001FBBBC7A|nr:hypothetical protein [Methylobacterium sp. E-045]MCJ2129345.1 hypothetical protein [Methylobacterium sp. E-045]